MIKQDAEYKEGNKTFLSAYAAKPFDEAKAELEKEGYKIISLEENAKLRIAEGLEHSVSQNGNYVREGFLYVPKKGIFLARNSPILDNAQEATDCHRKGKEFYLNPKQVEKSLADSIQVKIKGGESIPTDKFGEDELAVYAFGKNARKYGEFLREEGIKEMPVLPVYLTSMQENSFARQAWLLRFVRSDRSDLLGDYRLLCYGNDVRGVRVASAEGAKPAKKIETYTFKEVEKALKIINGVKQGTLGTSKLEDIVDFLESLKQ